MELGAKGTAGPTGRVVAFANSVVFQVSSGLFKQIPGVNFSWREMVLTLPPGVDVAAIKERLVAVVTEALKDYHGEILRQTKEIARTTRSSSAGDAQPRYSCISRPPAWKPMCDTRSTCSMPRKSTKECPRLCPTWFRRRRRPPHRTSGPLRVRMLSLRALAPSAASAGYGYA